MDRPASAQPAPGPAGAAPATTLAEPAAPGAGGIQLAPTTTQALPPPPGGAGPAPDGSAQPGLFDISGHVEAAIDNWFRDLVTSALSPVLDLLGHSVLATPNVADQGRVREIWALSLGIANAAYVLLVLAGGAIVMGHETLQTRYSAKEIAPRLVLGAVAANASLSLAGWAISVANSLSGALLGQGVDPARALATLDGSVLGPIHTGGIFVILLGLAAAVLGVVLVATYIVRVALVVVLVAGAPLALAAHGLPQTEGLARLWWRAATACLAVQVGQSLVLVTAVRVFFGSGGPALFGPSSGGTVVDLLVAACLFWVLVRIPTWAAHSVFGAQRTTATTKAVRDFVVYKVIRRAAAAGAV